MALHTAPNCSADMLLEQAISVTPILAGFVQHNTPWSTHISEIVGIEGAPRGLVRTGERGARLHGQRLQHGREHLHVVVRQPQVQRAHPHLHREHPFNLYINKNTS